MHRTTTRPHTARTAFVSALALALAGTCLDARADVDLPRNVQLSSPAFSKGGTIPSRYTCDGAGTSPPLRWSNLPPDTKSVAVLVDDPDAPRGPFAHWVLYNLKPEGTGLDEGARLGGSGHEGKNSRGEVGWTPPCPPSGTHHYRFRVYALSSDLAFRDAPTEDDLLKAAKELILSQGELVGVYKRGSSQR
jgi:Raf kinase inhibitor-like YbhB/YbcL family protein